MSAHLDTEADAGSKNRKSPEQIEREIDETRAELSRTLDALQAKLSVRRKVHSALDTARENGMALAQMTRRTIRDHPVPAILAGVSAVLIAAWLRRSRSHESH